MNLKCPKCQTIFKVDESDYAAILQQVRNTEFNDEVNRRLKELKQQYDAETKAMVSGLEKFNEKKLADKEREKENLEKTKDTEILNLKSQIAMLKKQNELDVINERNNCKDEIHAKEQAITELTSKLQAQAVAAENKVHEINEYHNAIIKAKDEEIEHYKDMKSRLSTKMLGETLEQHCQNMFNRARSQGQFLTAYFEKDNDISVSGTKGDFIFRDYLDGDEYISIMFEMKNEVDTTATKHRNEDFFAKLDKDRHDKKCEYAVLVSTLEADNEYYNEGIVDVSYRYDKMIVIRPQFFMAVIVMLSRTAMRGAKRLIDLKHDLAIAQAQSIDVTKFEARRDKFVSEFGKLVEAHLKKQDDALAAIDKAIEAAEKQADNLRKVKALFETSRQKLVSANEKAENDFTIRKLTYGNPTMKAKFDEARTLREQENLD
jgi:predicted Zn finger-like uncharacterized protein